jgi:hypothetical protein
MSNVEAAILAASYDGFPAVSRRGPFHESPGLMVGPAIYRSLDGAHFTNKITKSITNNSTIVTSKINIQRLMRS